MDAKIFSKHILLYDTLHVASLPVQNIQMLSNTLPMILQGDISESNTSAKCCITMGEKVYNITEFLGSHPGGEDLILAYGGKDVTDILQHKGSHAHSEAAYDILEDYLIELVATDKEVSEPKLDNLAKEIPSAVFLRTGVASAEDLSKDTDADTDYETHKFLDLNKPLFLQVLFGGFRKDFYLEQVHRPRHFKGGDSAPIFGNFLEPLTKTPWWIIPFLWGPLVAYGTFIARDGCTSWAQVVAYWIFGLFMWSLVEYGLHRCLFHLDHYLADNSVAITAHFFLHGVHHYLPMDKYRLVMPPTMFVFLALPFWKLAHTLFYWNWHVATAVFCGGVFGYIGTLLHSSLSATVLLPSSEEISSSASLHGLREWIWDNQPLLGQNFRHGTDVPTLDSGQVYLKVTMSCVLFFSLLNNQSVQYIKPLDVVVRQAGKMS